MGKISASGVYDLPMSEYRGQPADAMSMASSDAVILTEATPAHLKAAWADDSDDSKEADIGTLIHALILEPHRRDKMLAVIDAEITIAGNMKAMFKGIEAVGADTYNYGAKTVGSILINRMKVAGS